MTTYHTKEKDMPRTIGSKDKKPRARKPRATKPAISFAQQLDDWDKEEHVEKQKPVDLQELCEKLQSALAKSYVDYQELEKDMEWFTRLSDVHEAQLDIKEKRINFMELELAQIKAGHEGIFRDEE